MKSSRAENTTDEMITTVEDLDLDGLESRTCWAEETDRFRITRHRLNFTSSAVSASHRELI
jgi:hypothetical protein